jgi:Protein of unknown function (DUF2726)
MEWLIVTSVVVVIILLIVRRFARRPNRLAASPYTRHVSVFSPAEAKFLHVLDRAVGQRYRIFGKIRVADVIAVRKDLDPGGYRTAFSRIGAKHFDFVLCSRWDFSIVGVIELNDSSHLHQKRAQRDAFLIDICNAIGLPILIVRARRQYSASRLRSIVAHAFASDATNS